MAFAAGLLDHAMASWFGPDIVWKTAKRECQRMEEAVRSLGSVFRNHVMRRVAIVAFGSRAVAAFYLAVVIRIHDMAVGASSGAITEI